MITGESYPNLEHNYIPECDPCLNQKLLLCGVQSYVHTWEMVHVM